MRSLGDWGMWVLGCAGVEHGAGAERSKRPSCNSQAQHEQKHEQRQRRFDGLVCPLRRAAQS